MLGIIAHYRTKVDNEVLDVLDPHLHIKDIEIAARTTRRIKTVKASLLRLKNSAKARCSNGNWYSTR